MERLDFTTDFHTHILPNIDDGAENVHRSVELVSHAVQVGIKTICLTPHFYAHRVNVDTFLEHRQAAYEELKAALDKAGIEVELLLGAEVLVFPNIDTMEGIERLTLQQHNVMLLEFPFSRTLVNDEYYATVGRLAKRFDVVLAHANRYCDSVVDNVIAEGAYIQLNASDVCKFDQRKRIRYWMECGYVGYLGSDVHRDAKNYAKFKRAVNKLSK